MMNHHPTQLGIWFPYNGWRYKDVYHIRLHSGEVLRCMYPNGSGWYPEGNSTAERRVDDSEVAEVMLAPDADVDRYRYTGETRINDNLKTFAEYIPDIEDCQP